MKQSVTQAKNPYLRHINSLLALLLAFTLFACNNDEPAPALPQPAMDKIEVGLGNNEIGVIGEDFHLNAEILAGDKIENVQVKIQQRSDETYAKEWSHEIIWEQYKGAKNATIHKHFNIPADAAEGKYDFLIIVNDQNGTKFEEKRTLNIYAEENLPVNPQLSIFNILTKEGFFYRRGNFIEPGQALQKDDTIASQVTISGVKGDGKMYLLLINKKFNHRPESVEQIDFNKAIVYDVFAHEGWENADHFSNSVFDEETFTTIRNLPDFKIGAAADNNIPPASIGGANTWESGTYYFGVVYKNTTYNMTFFHYIEIPIEIN
ncbi:DUF4625 domain-containing protein [Cesiribacter sp. SM1]|uniref:DUF4625 domain-containing protein n=1 Tax=Cesiribacter sp. SM1 TaxID=2861196 RepID=UPI001CD78388|nr:DUF4625 domain-containing protein [Cesiribacter sp. SM1]